MLSSFTGPNEGFVAGTLVHTMDGLVPIEKIKVGDRVLSQSENRGDLVHKRVANTFQFQQKSVCSVNFYISATEKLEGVVVTGSHPFWIKHHGWTFADQLYCGASVDLADGREAEVSAVRPVFATVTEGVGWIPSIFGGDDTQNYEYGSNIDFRNGDPSTNYRDKAKLKAPRGVPEDLWRLGKEDSRLKVTVYNIEIDHFHTYYVGRLGVWVHNLECCTLGGIRLLPRSASRSRHTISKPYPSATQTRTAERSSTHSHAERGNDKEKDCGGCS